MRDAVPPCGTTGGAGAPGALVERRRPRRGDDRRGGAPEPARRAAPEGPAALIRVRRGGTPARWCGWGPWGDPGRAVVQICCKGAPRPDRPREEARNINDPPPAPGSIRAFATDLDKRRRRGPLGGRPRAERRPRRAPRRPGGPLTTGRGPPGRHAPGRTTATRSSRSDGAHGSAARPARTRAPAPPVRPGPPVDAPRCARSSLDPRERLLEVRARRSSDVLAGQVTCSQVK